MEWVVVFLRESGEKMSNAHLIGAVFNSDSWQRSLDPWVNWRESFLVNMVTFSALSRRAVSPVCVCVEYCTHVHMLVLSRQILIAWEENANDAEMGINGENIVFESITLVQQAK